VELNSHTERLYYTDCYRKSFRARLLKLEDGGRRVMLDRTAFYPASGGQPHDGGRIGGAQVADVIDGQDGIVHLLSSAVADEEVDCEIDWTRRFDHMQQHTGQHLLSAVFSELFEIPTVSFHMGTVSSTIDLNCALLTPEQLREAEERANRVVQENRMVGIDFEDAAAAEGVRKASGRLGSLRIVSIDNLDRSACGGTHVRATGEIGAILLRSVEKIRGSMRLEFLCGGRAIRRARADYDALESVARAFSSALNEVPSLVSRQSERLKQSEKNRHRLTHEVAGHRGRLLYGETPVTESKIRLHGRVLPEGPFAEDLRPEANGFVSQGRAVFIAVACHPAAVMLVASGDSGIDAGKILRTVLPEFAGKGGGSAQMAQGSFTGSAAALLARVKELLRRVE
jgi:alanyl-tRNA synthetase